MDADGFEARVRAALDELAPMLAADGGAVELVRADAERLRVEVRLTGACRHCAAATLTMTHGVERRLRERIPELRQVVRV